MRPILLLLVALATACTPPSSSNVDHAADSLALAQMIATRAQAMIDRDLPTLMAQFADDATWINSQGYYFAGKGHIRDFHTMLATRDSVDYTYVAGTPRIRLLDAQHALAYYGWQMVWYPKANPADTTFNEIGLMTLTAQKRNDTWQWVAVTNQHTPWFYAHVEAVTIE